MDLRIPFIFCIDVEPDEHVYMPDDPSSWSGFEAWVAESAALRNRLSALTGEPARFTWSLRLDPQIAEAYGDPAWIVDKHDEFFDGAQSMGDAVGVHPHAWRWDRRRRVWIADHEDAAWIDFCTEMSFTAFRSRFGVAPSHHRFGSRFVSERLLATVERLGARVDLTLEPGEEAEPPGERLGGIFAGEIPDQVEVPRVPYHPHRSNFRHHSDGNGVELWAIPLSAGRHIARPQRRGLMERATHPVRSARGVAFRVRHKLRRARRGATSERRPVDRVLRMHGVWQNPADLWRSAFASLKGREHPYLAFAIRSDMQPSALEGMMAALEQHPHAKRLVFTTPEDALCRLGLLAETSPQAAERVHRR